LAWGKGRAKDVAQTVERVAAIFPFEADVYREAGANVTFVGHPLLDIVQPSMMRADAYEYFQADPARPMVMLMPGSRGQEVSQLLPIMLAACQKIRETVPNCQFFLPLASTISREMLQNIINNYQVPVSITTGNNYDLMRITDVAIAASGTATLETSIMQVPTVIIYKLNPITYFLGKFLVKIPHIGLPNIVAGREIVPELLQSAVNPDNIAQAALPILTDNAVRGRILTDLAEVKHKLGEVGAVKRVAQVILEIAQSTSGGQ
jgi:lipid-A-disaccharide synthase